METKYYTVERGQQILLSLLKQHGIKRIIASPGTTNITFVASAQHDSWFEIYSSVDERSAAYLACGMAAETGDPVVLSCTGATASRNYVSGMTEAYYRKLPILAVTATQNENRVGHLIPQMMDRSQQMKDICVHSEHIAVPRNADDEWDVTIRLNRAVLALYHRGGGPVHINLATDYNRDFSIHELPLARCVRRYLPKDNLPVIPQGRVAIKVGNHKRWSDILLRSVNLFCQKYGALVFCDHSSNYTGPFRVHNGLLSYQSRYNKSAYYHSKLLIHIGEVSGYSNEGLENTEQVWRVNEDGELRDPYRKLTKVFEMTEEEFFFYYINQQEAFAERETESEKWLQSFHTVQKRMQAVIPELPFSNVWVAQQTTMRLPENSVLHLAILNSFRTWNLFELPVSVQSEVYANTGGFGIDGCMSSMIGGAIVHPEQLHFLVIGDLAFFYDLNVLGNRHVGDNVRILLINNGKGTEFRNYNHFAAQFGESADEYIAAARHYGNKSLNLVRHLAEDLGYEYLSANNKEEYLSVVERFVDIIPNEHQRSMIFEVFTNNEDESDALQAMSMLMQDPKTFKQQLKRVLPELVIEAIHKQKRKKFF
mgnify:CR=1 FL=1